MKRLFLVVLVCALMTAGCNIGQGTSGQVDNAAGDQSEQSLPGKYSNSKYGISFEYPKDWKIRSEEYDQLTEDKLSHKALLAGVALREDGPGPFFTIRAYSVHPSMETFGKCLGSPESTTTISGIPARMCGVSTEIGGATGPSFYIEHNKLFYEIFTGQYTGSDKVIIDNIIASVKIH